LPHAVQVGWAQFPAMRRGWHPNKCGYSKRRLQEEHLVDTGLLRPHVHGAVEADDMIGGLKIGSSVFNPAAERAQQVFQSLKGCRGADLVAGREIDRAPDAFRGLHAWERRLVRAGS